MGVGESMGTRHLFPQFFNQFKTAQKIKALHLRRQTKKQRVDTVLKEKKGGGIYLIRNEGLRKSYNDGNSMILIQREIKNDGADQSSETDPCVGRDLIYDRAVPVGQWGKDNY